MRLLAAGIQLDQLLGHLLGGGLDLFAGLGPIGAAKVAQLDIVAVARRRIAGQQIQLGDRHIQHIFFVVLDAQVVLLHTLHGHTLDARVPADAVALVYDQIADGDLAQAVQGILAALFLFLRTADAERTGCKDRVPGKRQAAPGG